MALPQQHSGWTNRGYLPHYDNPRLIQAVTFRLADSLPQSKRGEWEQLLQIAEYGERIRRLEQYLDQGTGSCVLRQPECAAIVQDSLLHFHQERYRIIAWCVMPNHVHALFETFPHHPLGRVIHSWKTFTAQKINRWCQRRGPNWQEDYFDTFMRDAEHAAAEAAYIESNPVNAGLVKQARDWPWSSASYFAATKIDGS